MIYRVTCNFLIETEDNARALYTILEAHKNWLVSQAQHIKMHEQSETNWQICHHNDTPPANCYVVENFLFPEHLP